MAHRPRPITTVPWSHRQQTGKFLPSELLKQCQLVCEGTASAATALTFFPSKADADAAMADMSNGLIRSGWQAQEIEGLNHEHACLTLAHTNSSEALCYMTRDDALIISYSTVQVPTPDAALLNAIDLANAMNDAYDQVERPE